MNHGWLDHTVAHTSAVWSQVRWSPLLVCKEVQGQSKGSLGQIFKFLNRRFLNAHLFCLLLIVCVVILFSNLFVKTYKALFSFCCLCDLVIYIIIFFLRNVEEYLPWMLMVNYSSREKEVFAIFQVGFSQERLNHIVGGDWSTKK